ncbi:MAG: MFS transporter [Chloroflexota bacterium]|nr:MFS transporter [Chloroflexota bacterium]
MRFPRSLSTRWRDGAASARGAMGRYRAFGQDRDATRLLGAGILSATGDWLNTVALIALAFDFGDGLFGVGGLLTLRMLARLLLQGPAGAIVDRFPGRRPLLAAEIVMTVIAAAFSLLLIFPSLWLAFALVVALEAVNTLARAGFIVRLLAVVAPGHRPAANGLYAMGLTISQSAGAVFGGIVYTWLGPLPLFIANALTFAVVAAVLLRIREGRAVVPDGEAVTPGPAPADTVAARPIGYASLLRRRDVATYVAMTIPVAATIQSTIVFFIVRANAFDLGDGGTGVFFAATAVGFFFGGAIAGAGIYTGIRSLYLVAAAEVVGVMALVFYGAVDTLALALVMLLLAGIASEISEVPALSYFQHVLPEEIFGRFYALFSLAAAAGSLMGLALSPVLQPRIGLVPALLVVAVPAILAAGFIVAYARSHEASRGVDHDGQMRRILGA